MAKGTKTSILCFMEEAFLLCAVLACLFLFSACNAESAPKTKIDSYYISGSPEDRESLASLFTLLDSQNNAEAGKNALNAPGAEDFSPNFNEPGEIERFAIIREIANNYTRQKEYSKLINFLTSRVNSRPGDVYNTYYLFMTAYAYMQQEAYPAAALYFDMVVKNYPDLTIQGESIHLACLKQLINLVNESEQQVWYYEELISRFSDRIDLGVSYFMLAQAYEKTGEWNGAIRAYTQYLPYVESNIPGFPNAYAYAKQLVDFNKSPKDWSFDSLNSLVNAIKTALDAGSATRIEQFRAKVNFFTRTWEQEAADDSGMADFYISDFVRGSRIRYNAEIDAGSNANEAYLRTWGWTRNISTWYLYFRKIYFPSDPEIHGRWEWAGIYYGEKI